MPSDNYYPEPGRHANPEPVGRRGLLKAGLVLGSAAAAGAGFLTEHLLTRHGSAVAASAPRQPAAHATHDAAPTASATTRSSVAAKPLAGKLIVLDPGHNPNNIHHLAQINALTDAGGFLKACNTVGTETDEGYPEWAFNLDVARHAKKILRDAGARVIMTQNGHTPYGPCNDWRAWIANRAHAHASVAIHADGGPANGYGFAALTPIPVDNQQANNTAIIKASGELAQAMLRHFGQSTGEPLSTYLGANGIQPRDDLAGLNLSTVPKIFIECANMRNADDAARCTDPHWRQAAAHGIAAAISAFVLQ